MLRKYSLSLVSVTLALFLSACASEPVYSPVAAQPQAIDMSAFAPKVEAFVVVLDISSSMAEDYQERPKVQAAQDLVASFTASVTDAGFKAGLVTFGKGTGRCFGMGEASEIYGLTDYQEGEFANALGAIPCAGGTTPLSEGIDAAGQMLGAETGPVAVIVVSDFQWVSAGRVAQSVAALKAQHGDNLCLHTVKVGDNTTGDAMIEGIINAPGCDSAVAAADLADAGSMATYVSETLLAPLVYEKHSVSATALFDFDKALLKEQGKAELHNLGEYIKGKGITVVDLDVIGHTDSMGSEEYNQGLSERRAAAVRDYLVANGVAADIIDVSGKGETDPVADNATAEGRALNRRVDIHLGTSRVKN
jgi:OOP family OmpA-OmpF porin